MRNDRLSDLIHEAGPHSGAAITAHHGGHPEALAARRRADLHIRLPRRSVLFSAALLPLPAAWLHDADERGRHAAGPENHARTVMVGEAEVATVRQMTQAFNAADETLGGGYGQEAVAQFLRTDVAAYLRAQFRNETTRQAMYGAAAELAYLTGFKAHDMQMEGAAQRYYAHALQLAQQSGDRAHPSWVFRILAHQALDLQQPGSAVDLAENAWRLARGRVSPEVESLYSITVARAHGAAGNKKIAARAIHQAEENVSHGVLDVPRWAAVVGNVAATVRSHAGKTFTSLGAHAEAENRFLRSADLRPTEGFRRILALDLAQVAEAQAAQGRAEEACRSWERAFEQMPGVNSARHRAAIGRARGYLRQYSNRRIPGAAALNDRSRELLNEPHGSNQT